jgi:hypothetical protein
MFPENSPDSTAPGRSELLHGPLFEDLPSRPALVTWRVPTGTEPG